MSQRCFYPAEYTLSQNLKLVTLTLNLVVVVVVVVFRFRVTFWDSFRFCLSGVLRWAKISLAHFSGRTRCY